MLDLRGLCAVTRANRCANALQYLQWLAERGSEEKLCTMTIVDIDSYVQLRMQLLRKRAAELSITHIFLIGYEYLLRMFRESEIEIVRVCFQHGAACRNQTCEGAAGLLLSVQTTRALGLIANWPTANSKMRGSGNDFGRCSSSCRRVLADRFRLRAKTGQTRKRRTASSIT